MGIHSFSRRLRLLIYTSDYTSHTTHFTTMSKIRERRVMMELKRLKKEQESGELPAGWEVAPKSDDDLYVWKAVIPGARDTPYEYGLFELEIKIGEKYPMKHPECKFVTPIYHPNVSLSDGCICVDILGSAWSPANSIKALLISLQLLMQDPEPNDPMESGIAREYKENREEFNENCKKHIKEHGILNPEFPMEKVEEEAEKPAETETVTETETPAPEVIENTTSSATPADSTENETNSSQTQQAPVLARRQSSVLEMLEQHSAELEENLQALTVEETTAEDLVIPAATATAELDVSVEN